MIPKYSHANESTTINMNATCKYMYVYGQLADQGYRHSVEASVSHNQQLTTANATEKESNMRDQFAVTTTNTPTCSEKTHQDKF